MNGSAHFRANVGAGAALTVAALVYRPEVAWLLAIGCALGTLITPDADLENRRTYPEGWLWRQVPPLGLLFEVAFWPYGLVFRHRGLSHFPVLGMLSRLVWLSVLVYGAVYVLAALLGSGVPRADVVLRWLWQPALLAGWLLMDLTHLLLDVRLR